MLTQAELKLLWHYDPDTGLFTRLVKSSFNVNIGDTANYYDSYGYIAIRISYKLHRAHRLAWLYVKGVWPANDIDHLDGVRDNNRFVNLRDVTRSVNLQNQRQLSSRNKSGYMGVYWNKQVGKWHAKIMVNGKEIHLGFFDCIHEAGAYRLKMKRELHEGCTI